MSSLLLVQFKADRCLCVCSKFHIFSSKKEGKPLKHHFPGVYNVNAYAHNFLQLSSYNQWLSISSPPIYTLKLLRISIIHAEGMYGCVTRYLVLYMRFWSTCLFFVKPLLPASPITRCVRYPDRLVPGMYVLPTPPVNPERPVSGTHHLTVLAPSQVRWGERQT